MARHWQITAENFVFLSLGKTIHLLPYSTANNEKTKRTHWRFCKVGVVKNKLCCLLRKNYHENTFLSTFFKLWLFIKMYMLLQRSKKKKFHSNEFMKVLCSINSVTCSYSLLITYFLFITHCSSEFKTSSDFVNGIEYRARKNATLF